MYNPSEQSKSQCCLYMYSFQNTGIHVMKYISEQETDCYITKFYQSLFFFYIHNPTFAEINKFLIFKYMYIHHKQFYNIHSKWHGLSTCIWDKKKKLLHYTTCTFSGVKNTVLKTTMILIKNQYNQMYKLTCTCTKEM